MSTPITTLQYWVQAVLPVVYDDSLSYLEFLGKLSAKLNEVIGTQNGLIDSFEDNLTTTVSTYLNVWMNDGTIAAMLADSLVAFTDAEIAHAASVAAEIATLQASVNNKMTNIFVNVKMFGAIGDGITIDHTAIQAAIDSLTTGGTVYFPTGTYLIGTDITIHNDNVKLQGSGRSSILKLRDNATVSGNGFIFAEGKTGITIESLAFDGNAVGNASLFNMVRLKDCITPRIQNCDFAYIYGSCMKLSGSVNLLVDACTFEHVTGAAANPGEGIYAVNIDGGSLTNLFAYDLGDHLLYLDSNPVEGIGYGRNVFINNVRAINCGVNGITNGAAFNICNDSRGFKLSNVTAINCRHGFYFHENAGPTGFTPTDYELVNCTADGTNFGAGFYLQGAAGLQNIVRAKLIGCVAKNNANYGFRIQDLEDISLDNCDALTNGWTGISFNHVKRFRIFNGLMINNSAANAATYYGISFDANSEDGLVFGVVSKNTVGTNQKGACNTPTAASKINISGGSYDIADKAKLTSLRSMIMMVATADSGNGILSVPIGSEYVNTIASDTYGLKITFKNIPTDVTPIIIPYFTSATALGSAATPFIYIRSVSYAEAIIGIKGTPPGTHVIFNTINAGSINLLILI